MVNDRERLIQSSWNDNAAAWTAAVRGERIESRMKVTNRAIVSAVQQSGAARVLDIGCGEGWLCRALIDLGIEAAGLDGTAELIARARELGGAEYYEVSYEQFAAHPESGGTGYDAAVCNFSLLGRDIAPVLRAAATVVEPSGLLILQTVHPFGEIGPMDRYEDAWRLEDFSALGSQFRSPMPWYFRTLGNWIAAVIGAGFDLEQCAEPIHPESGRPVSLLLIGRKKELVLSAMV
jgi:2-polyprenyl-3-methyl-5-hydroxy-6-metoxy-1,4-benzoquinol methylase